MRTVEEHRLEVTELLRGVAESLGAERLDVGRAAFAADPWAHTGRYLAEDVIAPAPLPGFDNSQMDGFAVIAAEVEHASGTNPVTLPVARRIAAGDEPREHRPGTATPVMTGAPLPPGADAVIPVERVDPPRFPVDGPVGGFTADDGAEVDGATADGIEDDGTTPDGTEAARIRIGAPVAAGTFVRVRGSDIDEGEVLLRAGEALTPARAGVVNGVGLTAVSVRRRLRVLLVPTGHEIRDPGEELGPGRIHDSNSVALTAALQSIGCHVDVRPCRSDDAEDLLALLAEAMRGGDAPAPDVLVTVGGVSAGAREVVRDALGPLGVRFEKVAMQPGGPQGLGMVDLGSPNGRPLPVVSLPGNPVSALVSFEAFLREALLTTAGAAPAAAARELRRAPIAHDLDSPPGVLQLRRGVLDPTVDGGVMRTVGGPSSHLLHSLAASSVLIHLPVGVDHVDAGTPLDFWRIDD